MDFTGQRIVVLGGTSGIGLATSRLAAEHGAAVVLASSSRDRVDAAVAALPAGAQGHVVDLTEPAAVRSLLDGLGGFDHLVFTAGESLALTPIASLDPAVARRFFELRYLGALTAVRYAVPNLRPGGSIVLTTGTAGVRPESGWTVAAGVCGAVDASVRALAVELAPIRVNAVRPGVVRTALWGSMSEPDRAALYRTAGAQAPLGRVAEPEDVAAAYLYLMGQRHATGTIVTVDGGAVLA